jgi:hypothetical protein
LSIPFGPLGAKAVATWHGARPIPCTVERNARHRDVTANRKSRQERQYRDDWTLR